MKTERTQENNVMSEEEKEQYSEIIRTMPWLYQPVVDEVAKHAGSCTNLLDAACGDGYLLELINEQRPSLRLTGLDIDQYFIKETQGKYPFQFMLGDALDLEESYDIITCNLALHHFDNPLDLVKKLYNYTENVLIVSDQLRPPTEKDLEERLGRRRMFVGDYDVPFYRENERSSILEAYSKEEIISIFGSLGLQYSITFTDSDYYERFVTVIKK